VEGRERTEGTVAESVRVEERERTKGEVAESVRVVSESEGAEGEKAAEECNDVHDLIEMLEKLHRINKVLESKEEQILTMKFECDVLTDGAAALQDPPNPTFDREVVEYREVNAALLRQIADNSSVLRGLKAAGEERRREVGRLEFDVNLIERESKRLQGDLTTVESIGLVPPGAPGHKEPQHLQQQQQQQQQQQPPPRVEPPPQPSPPVQCASPPGSSRGSDKSVRFNDREDVLRVCSSASSASLSPPPGLPPVLSPRSILKGGKGGYSSDSGSDTGVSSLSSVQGDYELSTLV
jgi:hypothetical protein